MSIDPGSLILGGCLGFAAGVGIVFVASLCASAKLADRHATEASRKLRELNDDMILHELAESQPDRWRVN